MHMPDLSKFRLPGLPSLPAVPTLPAINLPEVNIPDDPKQIIFYLVILLVAYLIFKKIFRYIALFVMIIIVIALVSQNDIFAFMNFHMSGDSQIIMLVALAVLFIMLAVKLFRLAFLLALAMGVYFIISQY